MPSVSSKAHPPVDPGWCVVLLQVRRYTPEFARYTIARVDGLLLTLQKRASLPDHYPWPVLTNYSDAVRHMLRLSTTDEGAQQQDTHVLADRAYLRVLYAAALVHSHSKVMEHDFSKGLLQLDHPGPAEAYTSDEDFHSVTEACREAQEAIQALYGAGGKLERGARWFIRDPRSALGGFASYLRQIGSDGLVL
ncbi:hypothetical protein F5B21DRAFT_166514 [Xylaria acuta]|nr:hypothetical protein F5B21DRAFT_166514 [Xylaria acuta]